MTHFGMNLNEMQSMQLHMAGASTIMQTGQKTQTSHLYIPRHCADGGSRKRRVTLLLFLRNAITIETMLNLSKRAKKYITEHIQSPN